MPKPPPLPGRDVLVVIFMDRLRVPMPYIEMLALARFRDYLERTNTAFECVDISTPSGKERAVELLADKMPIFTANLPILAILDIGTKEVLLLTLMPKDATRLIAAIKAIARN